MRAMTEAAALRWDGCLNVRDLGGHATTEGGTTRPGSIVRADSVRNLSEAGWAELVGHGIATIVDLRFHEELEADPPAELPVAVVHISLLGAFDPEYGTELDALAGAAGDTASGTAAVYLDFLERFRENFGRVVAAVADAAPGGVLVHCAAGKDRTGLVVALLLSLAGVAAEDVAADYAVTERNLAEATERWIAQAEDEHDRERRRRISACPPESMLGVLRELDRRYGSVHGYLLAAGASEEQLERVRARLR